jgi:hypothetical protein
VRFAGPHALLDEERHKKEPEIGNQPAGGALRIRGRKQMHGYERDEERHGTDREPGAAKGVPGAPGEEETENAQKGERTGKLDLVGQQQHVAPGHSEGVDAGHPTVDGAGAM